MVVPPNGEHLRPVRSRESAGRRGESCNPAHTIHPPAGGLLEMVSLSGRLSGAGAHLHELVADPAGRVVGGHLGCGTTVRTTVKVLLGNAFSARGAFDASNSTP